MDFWKTVRDTIFVDFILKIFKNQLFKMRNKIIVTNNFISKRD